MTDKKKSLSLFLLMQFFCALADNALIFAEIATLKKNHSPGWEIPLLQDFFIIGYIILAPFMALIADKWSKKYVLLGATILKLIGAIMLLIGINPLLCCVIIGIGSASFSPAKYGVLPELVKPEDIIKANGYLEGVTILAVLIGVIMGGIISDHSTILAFQIIIGLFLISNVVNILIPNIQAAAPNKSINPKKAIEDFISSFKKMYKNSETRYAILDTSIFNASGATLRFLLVAWVPLALNTKDNEIPAILNSFVAIGLAIGAVIVGKFITVKTINKSSYFGILIGILVILMTFTTTIYSASITLVAMGILGGIFLIPLNALVQEEGKKTVGSGHSVAVQNFCENLLMLIMVGLYSYLLKQNVDILTLAVSFGLFISISIGIITLFKIRTKKTKFSS